MDTPVFDASRPIAINLRTPEGVKTVRVRFPSDDEWIERQRRRKAIIKQLGRGFKLEVWDVRFYYEGRLHEENVMRFGVRGFHPFDSGL